MRAAPAIKFCGLTRPADIRAACALGVEYIGLVFADGSARRVDLAQAKALAACLRAQPQPARLVALLRDTTASAVEDVIAAIEPDLLQFHGSEDEAFCERFGLPYWKALGLRGVRNAQALVAHHHPRAQALLLDAHAPGAAGGTGEAFDWQAWPRSSRRLVLAGGLKPDNVAAAIGITRPFAVDVSSGIESAPGVKDPACMRAFVLAVRGTAAA